MLCPSLVEIGLRWHRPNRLQIQGCSWGLNVYSRSGCLAEINAICENKNHEKRGRNLVRGIRETRAAGDSR